MVPPPPASPSAYTTGMVKLAGVFLACVMALAAADKVTVIRAARLFDGKSDGVTTPGVVVVVNNRVAGVGPNASIPAGAETIDLGDATLLPGFMDAHTHVTMPFERDYRNSELAMLKKPVSERTLDAVENVRRTLMAGFTTVRDLGGADLIDVGLRNAIAAGKIPGPRMIVATNALGATGGHCDPFAGYAPGIFGRESGITDGVINSPDQARQAVRYNLNHGADVIKVCATGGVLSLTDDVDTPQLTQAELDALVDEAHALRRKTAAHAHGAAGAKRAIRAGIDSIEHGSFLDDEALDMMKARGTYFVPTLMAVQGLKEMMSDGFLPPAVDAKAKAAMASLDAVVRKAIVKGIKIAVGTDAAVYPHGRNAGEMVRLVELGMTPAAALHAATRVDAELFGIAARTGTLEPGMLADIVACPSNPLDDIRQVEKVRFVMKEGTVYRRD
jgi:imidazolonepropionase-like amidohydrolase